MSKEKMCKGNTKEVLHGGLSIDTPINLKKSFCKDDETDNKDERYSKS